MIRQNGMTEIAKDMISKNLIIADDVQLDHAIHHLQINFENYFNKDEDFNEQLYDYTFSMLSLMFAPFDPETKNN